MEELIGGLGQSIPGVVGGLLANQQSQENAQYMFNQSKDLANTAHQREVQDLRAAGLNPILSAGGGGAPSPLGASPQMQNAFADVGKIMQGNRAQNQQDTQLDIAQQQADAQDDANQNTANKIEADNAATYQETRYRKNENDIIEAILPKVKSGIEKMSSIPDALNGALNLLNTHAPRNINPQPFSWGQDHVYKNYPDEVHLLKKP